MLRPYLCMKWVHAAAIGSQSPPVHLYPGAMQFVQCVLAEWALVAPRLTRTRLGITLVALAAVLGWLGTRGMDPFTVTLLAGSLGAIVAAAGSAGGENERRALSTALSHPTTPLAIAAGRWVALFVPAVVVVLACTAVGDGSPARASAGIIAAAAVGACALALVVPLGNAAAIGLFIFMGMAGVVAPERLVAVAHPGLVRVAAASALELGPALWHYRDVATGDWGAIAHALAWTGLGILVASAFIARRRALNP